MNDRGILIGGIFYEMEDGRGTHLEKIVVAERLRRRGGRRPDEGVLQPRCAAGATTVTTGFFRPEYFYGYGSRRIVKRYASVLVNDLETCLPQLP